MEPDNSADLIRRRWVVIVIVIVLIVLVGGRFGGFRSDPETTNFTPRFGEGRKHRGMRV